MRITDTYKKTSRVFLFLVAFTLVSLELIAEDIRWVVPSVGLRMRKEANTSSPVVLTMPYGSSVTVLKEEDKEETIGGKAGKWVMIDYEGKTGYAFSAFLTKERITTDIAELAGEYINLTQKKEYAQKIPPYATYLFKIFPDGSAEFPMNSCNAVYTAKGKAVLKSTLLTITLMVPSTKTYVTDGFPLVGPDYSKMEKAILEFQLKDDRLHFIKATNFETPSCTPSMHQPDEKIIVKWLR